MTNGETLNDRTVETLLTALTQDLKHLQQDLIVQLTRDVTRLQSEKTRLLSDISNLETRQQQLSPDVPPASSELPPEPETEEDRQAWVRQLAQLVAANLESQLSDRVEDLVKQRLATLSQPPAAHSDRLRDSVDVSFHRSYSGLRQELDSYRSDLSQHLNQLQTLQQQGEAILDTLVSRLSHELRDEVTRMPQLPQRSNGAVSLPQGGSQVVASPTSEAPVGDSHAVSSSRVENEPATPSVPDEAAEVEPPAQDQQPTAPTGPNQVRTGLLLALSYAAVLSLFNISIKVILSERTIFGSFDWGGIISPSLGNSMLILFLRMVVVVLLMPVLANQLYPQWWHDIQQFLRPENRKLQYQVAGSGFALFLSQVLIYIAIGNIPTAVAITLFFIFPVATVLGAWVLFGAKPTAVRSIIMAVILFGSIITVPDFFSVFSGSGMGGGGGFFLGSFTAVGSGIAFAGYVLLTQLCGKQLHPIPFSWANFSTVFVFSFLGLFVAAFANWGIEVPQDNFTALIGSGIWLGALTLISYVLNNFAIKYAGASLASIVGAVGPALTALFGLIFIGEELSRDQIIGMFIVTAGVVGLSLERMFLSKK
ncbi:DMT family transporter [Baaleninema sp.]|uniref:DMT family transporter n=1 Tax=Baaleninema sp. TaxID=3101197 RepID=UPI003CFF5A21